jgi:hypothetical protein
MALNQRMGGVVERSHPNWDEARPTLGTASSFNLLERYHASRASLWVNSYLPNQARWQNLILAWCLAARNTQIWISNYFSAMHMHDSTQSLLPSTMRTSTNQQYVEGLTEDILLYSHEEPFWKQLEITTTIYLSSLLFY